MHTLDGADAGGQFFRRALTLSALESTPVRLEQIRGDRPEPGLAQQHLAALELMSDCCDATVSGAMLGSKTVTFDPGTGETVPGGHYTAEIETAGSLTLLVDTLLPLATRLESALTVRATGGTDVAWSPPVDFLRYVKLPLLRQCGLGVALEVERRGFYPAGGGEVVLHLFPSTLTPLWLTERGPLESVRLYSTEAAALADADVATRQCVGARRALEAERDDVELAEQIETTAASDCPGTAIVIVLTFDAGEDEATPVAGFSALGEPGTPAERVGQAAADAALAFLEQSAPVDEHLADQLLDVLALAGGRLFVPTLTNHVETSLRLLERFGYDLSCDERDAGAILASPLE